MRNIFSGACSSYLSDQEGDGRWERKNSQLDSPLHLWSSPLSENHAYTHTPTHLPPKLSTAAVLILPSSWPVRARGMEQLGGGCQRVHWARLSVVRPFALATTHHAVFSILLAGSNGSVNDGIDTFRDTAASTCSRCAHLALDTSRWAVLTAITADGYFPHSPAASN